MNTPHPYTNLVGKNIVVRTVTMIYVGNLISIFPGELVLRDASWIPETGRWTQFVAEGDIRECEPYPDGQSVIVGRGAIVDVTEWRSELPRRQR